MKFPWRCRTLLTFLAAAGAAIGEGGTNGLPVRGLHLGVPAKQELPAALAFIRTALPREGVNTLILEFDYSFDFQSRPEFAAPDQLSRGDVAEILTACRAAGVELIPQINCLGHQSWAQRTGRLLEKHPEFDETPGKFPGNTGIYCRSYCPLHPDVHAVLFDLIDELVRACEARAFHCGMDEVFLLADPDCPRCRGKDPAELFAGEVKVLRDHLASVGCRMWMWGDRLIDGKATGIGAWEASENGIHRAVDLVPKDIVICDWHYERSPATPEFFAARGFDVVACPWRKAPAALEQLGRIRALRSGPDATAARHALGVLQTTWCGFSAFRKAYEARAAGEPARAGAPDEAAACFSALYEAVRAP